MPIKKYEVTHGVLSKCYDDEPVFVIRGNDPISSIVVRLYGAIAREIGATSEKAISIEAIAAAMETYKPPKGEFTIKNYGKCLELAELSNCALQHEVKRLKKLSKSRLIQIRKLKKEQRK